MRQRFGVVCFLCLFMTVGMPMAVHAADVAKIGVVDFQRILKESLAGKEAAKLMRQKQDERSEDLKNRQEVIVDLQKNIESIELTGDKSDRDQKKLELSIKLDEFKEADLAFAGQLKDINAKQTEEIRKDVFDVIENIGKKGGYLLILEKGDTVYAPVTTDITAKVIEEYNDQYQRNH